MITYICPENVKILKETKKLKSSRLTRINESNDRIIV